MNAQLTKAVHDYTKRNFGGETRSELVSEIGTELLRAMQKKIKEHGMHRELICVNCLGTSGCHGKCPAKPKASGRRFIKYCGMPCVSFSSRGPQMDLVHETCKLFATELEDLKADPPDYAMIECTSRFPANLIQEDVEIAALFWVFVMSLSPTDFGQPYSRGRTIVLLANKEKYIITLEPTAFLEKCLRTVCLSGNVFLCASKEEIQSYKDGVARKRRQSSRLPWPELLTVSESMRFREQKEKAMQKFDGVTGLFSLLDQNDGYESMGPLLPCLTRGNHVWSWDEMRTVVPSEALLAHGFPCTAKLEKLLGVGMPFDPSALKPADLYSLVGNGQSLQVMGWANLWCLAFTAQRDMPTVQGSLSVGCVDDDLAEGIDTEISS